MSKIMKRVVVLVLMIAYLLPVSAQQNSAEQYFSVLKQKLDNVKDYTADVRVNIDVSFMKVPPLSGKLYFKAPDKMKLERNGGISILPKKDISLTLNTMLPDGDVTIIDAGADKLNGATTQVIKVIPNTDNSDIILTKIWIDKERKLALRTETTTRDNGTVKMDLQYGKYVNYSLPDKVTVFVDVKEYKLPKGVTMDYDTGQQAEKSDNKPKKGKIVINYLSYKVNTGLSDAIFVEKQ